MLKKVLVVLACYNGERWIDEQITSIINQHGVSVKIIIFDDLSTDGTVDKLNNLRINYSNIDLRISKETSGSAGSNFIHSFQNLDIDDFDYIALSDQDDVWQKNKLIRAVECLENSDCVGYSSPVISFWANGKRKLLTQSSDIRELDFLFEGAGQGCTFVLRKEIFCRIRSFIGANFQLVNKFYYHDWLLYLLIRAWNLGWFFDSQPLMFYRQHELNDTGSRGTLKSITKRFGLIKSGWYRDQISRAIKICAATKNFSTSSYIRLMDIFNEQNTLCRRYRLSILLYQHSRRRLSDRVVLVLSVLLGYI